MVASPDFTSGLVLGCFHPLGFESALQEVPKSPDKKLATKRKKMFFSNFPTDLFGC
jgi:hypothetical protein